MSIRCGPLPASAASSSGYRDGSGPHSPSLPVAALRLTSVVSMQDRHFAGPLIQRAGESPRWPL